MKKLISSNIAGQFTLIEQRQFTGGENKGKFWESETTVFQNKDLANLAGQLSAKGNTVFIGITEHEVNGKIYYQPNFNFWD